MTFATTARNSTTSSWMSSTTAPAAQLCSTSPCSSRLAIKRQSERTFSAGRSSGASACSTAMGSVTAEVFQAPLTTVTALRVRAVRVPLDHPHRTASGVITESPLVLTDVLTGAGTTGHSMVFTYTNAALKPTADLIKNFEPLVAGEPLAPAHIEQKLAARFRLLGPQGLVGIALAAIDMALWDGLARLHGTSLVGLLGGAAKPVRAYGAVGYDGVSESAKVAEDRARRGFTGVKAKIGYPTVQEDVAGVCGPPKGTRRAQGALVRSQ